MEYAVSVVIPTYNRRAKLLRALAALPSDVEVIVVDDGSWDGTKRAVNDHGHAGIRCIRQANRGPASARNAGIAAASSEFVAFTDDDCVAIAPWPWPLVDRLRQEPRGVAGVGGVSCRCAKICSPGITPSIGSLSRPLLAHILSPPTASTAETPC